MMSGESQLIVLEGITCAVNFKMVEEIEVFGFPATRRQACMLSPAGETHLDLFAEKPIWSLPYERTDIPFTQGSRLIKESYSESGCPVQ